MGISGAMFDSLVIHLQNDAYYLGVGVAPSHGGTTGTATRRQSCMKARTAGFPASGATRSVHSTTPFTQTSPRIQRCMRPVSRWSRRRRTTIKQDIVVACNERDLLRRGLKLLEARE